MAAERKTARELVDEGLRETEKLISRKNYSEAMVASRQTLEYIIKGLCRRNAIPDGDLKNMIDDLYMNDVIDKDFCGECRKICILGERALQEGDNNAYNASTSYQLLSKAAFLYRSMTQKKVRRTSAKRADASERHASSGGSFDPFIIFKIAIPVLVLVLAVMIVKQILPAGSKTAAVTTAAVVETAAETAAPETTEAAPEETEPAVKTVYTTNTAGVRVRDTPSTEEGSKILTILDAGVTVDFVSTFDDQWSVINYNGGQAYIKSDLLTATEVPSESAAQ